MAYQPHNSHTDANRNLISNIHARGLSREKAATRTLNLAARMIKTGASGYLLKEELPSLENQSSLEAPNRDPIIQPRQDSREQSS